MSSDPMTSGWYHLVLCFPGAGINLSNSSRLYIAVCVDYTMTYVDVRYVYKCGVDCAWKWKRQRCGLVGGLHSWYEFFVCVYFDGDVDIGYVIAKIMNFCWLSRPNRYSVAHLAGEIDIAWEIRSTKILSYDIWRNVNVRARVKTVGDGCCAW